MTQASPVVRSWQLPFFNYGKGRQHFLLSPLDYPPSRTDGAVNGGHRAFTCCWLARLVWFVHYLYMFYIITYLQQVQTIGVLPLYER